MKQLPRVTLFVYAYNHADFVEKAIDAAFSQTYKNLEIILSDDNSTDNTFEIMKRKAQSYHGNQDIILNKNERNLGISEHLNKIMTLGSGDWFVLAAGDDISFPNRVDIIVDKIMENPAIMSFNSGFHIIDRNEKFKTFRGFNTKRLYVTGATGAWSRKIFDIFGPITQATSAEDVVIPFRALLLGKLFLLNNATIKYREHINSVSNPSHERNIDAQKHLKKICFNLINACEQRLLDLKIVENNIPKALYLSLKKKHQSIIVLLHERIKSIEKTLNVHNTSLFGKIEYIFTSSAIKKHDSFQQRVNQVLLCFRFIETLNKKRKNQNLLEDNTQFNNDILLDLVQLDKEKDLLIFL